MSVADVDKVDALCLSKDLNGLVLMITDNLDWSNEYMHLLSLQCKINSYIEYIETSQFFYIYSVKKFNYYTIKILFRHEITEKCFEFLESVSEQLKQYNISVLAEAPDSGELKRMLQ